jgi:hypothetical protein
VKPTSLKAAIRTDHEHTRKLLSKYREAWLSGDYPLAQVRFRTFRRAVARHLAWEEDALIQPLRCGISMVHQYQVMQRDADRHRLLRHALDRIDALLPVRKRLDANLDLRILELVAGLEELLDFHRTVFESQLVAELAGLLSEDAAEQVATALSEIPRARCN